MDTRTVKSVGLVLNAVLLVAFSMQPAKADVVIKLVGSPTVDTAHGGYDFTYDVRLIGNEEFSGANSNVTPQSVTLNNIATNQLTVLNVTGALKNNFTPIWSLTSTPSTPVTAASSSGQYNLSFAYNALSGSLPYGGIVQLGVGSYDLGTFTIVSPWIGTTAASYNGQGLTTFGASAGSVWRNVGSVFVPVDPPLDAVPEPASLVLMGAGLFMLVSLRHRGIGAGLFTRR
jgi:hypothetical protein